MGMATLECFVTRVDEFVRTRSARGVLRRPLLGSHTAECDRYGM